MTNATATAPAARPVVAACTIGIPGRIAGKGRARAAMVGGHARLHTPAATRAAESRVRDAWTAAGEPWVGEGPLVVSIALWEQRPAGHWTSKGELSAAGRRAAYPVRKPDLDNCAKLILDALNGCLYRDDAQVSILTVQRRWLPLPGIAERALVEVTHRSDESWVLHS